MASQIVPTTLTNLEFADIKNSLTDYLKTQPVFAGYDFQGSALSTIIDLLAYNSYYYAFYSNMITSEAFLDSAQRIESLISLTKPLGYTIPSKTAAKAKVFMTGALNPTISRHSVFFGSDSEGTQYKFYSLEDIPVVDSETDKFYIYEGKSLIDIEVSNELDVERQRIVFADTDFDLETLEVKVRLTDTDEIWKRIDNIGYSNTIEEKIYFVERVETGFMISFGLVNSVGKNVPADVASIRVRYIKTSGAKGNNISLFSSTLGNVLVNDGFPSFGGKNDPSIDNIKFLAPKWFASQERAVTVNDYKALIMEAGFFADENEFNVYGGEDIVPKRYGRVFVTSQKLSAEVTDLIEFIKQRSVITILPEYVNSIALNVYVSFSFGFNDGVGRTTAQKQGYVNSIKSLFADKYGITRRYNLYFSANEFITYINSIYPEIQMSSDSFKLFVEQEINASLSDYTFNLQNELDIPLGQSIIISEPFANTATTTDAVYVIKNTRSQSVAPVILTSPNLLTTYNTSVGTANITAGSVTIKSNIMTSPVKFIIPFKGKVIRIGLNNLVTFSIKQIAVS